MEKDLTCSLLVDRERGREREREACGKIVLQGSAGIV